MSTCIFEAVLRPVSQVRLRLQTTKSLGEHLFRCFIPGSIQGQARPPHTLDASPESWTSCQKVRESCSYLRVLPAGSRGTSS